MNLHELINSLTRVEWELRNKGIYSMDIKVEHCINAGSDIGQIFADVKDIGIVVDEESVRIDYILDQQTNDLIRSCTEEAIFNKCQEMFLENFKDNQLKANELNQ